VIAEVYRLICARRDRPRPDSYVAELLGNDPDRILKKIGEEACEVILAAKQSGSEALVHELADLTFHLLVLMASRGLSPESVAAELGRRFGVSGLEEKRRREEMHRGQKLAEVAKDDLNDGGATAGMKKVHLIGICGTAMAALAGMLHERGWWVSGSDAAAYPPMSELLAARGINVGLGYEPARLSSELSLVVVGNVAARSNVEVIRARELGLECRSLPETLWREFLVTAGRRLVVAGTHGKTTTASMLAWSLECCGVEPSFMIGGELINFSTNYRLTGKADFVLEGDEYNSAFFDRHAKFHHYRPTHLIITGIEMDHADLFAGLNEIVDEFRGLIASLPPSGLLVAAADCPVLAELLPKAPCRVLTYGWSPAADYRLLEYRPQAAGGRVRYAAENGADFEFSLGVLGRHNAENALAVLVMMLQLGLPENEILAGLRTFAGVKRRQELVGRCGNTIYISDFAHHPTAVGKTLAALREHFPAYRVLAVFEPRTATSRRNLFQRELEGAFAAADEVWLAPVHGLALLPENEALNTGMLAENLCTAGKPAQAFQRIEVLFEQLKSRSGEKELVVIMTTGDFAGLFRRLAAEVWK